MTDMDKRFNELLENVKNQILDVFPEMDRDDREEFFNRLNEWSYEKYEEALLESELETPDYACKLICLTITKTI